MSMIQTLSPLALHHEATGDNSKPSLVILHGLFGSTTNWRSVIRQLSADFYIIAVDLRNHGQSPWADTMTYLDMATDVAILLKALDLPAPSLLGHSMGGKVAMTMAQYHMLPLDKLIIADIAPVPYQHSHASFVQAMQQVDLESIKSRKDVDQQLSRDILESSTRQFLLQNLARIDGSYRWRINLKAIEQSMDQLLDYQSTDIANNRSMFIAGSLSHYVDDTAKQVILQLFPHASIEYIDDAGHWLHAEKPREFIQLVKEFLS